MLKNAIDNKKALLREQKRIKRKIAKLPDGGFRCYASGSYFNWYKVEKDECNNSEIRKYISKKDQRYAEQLAQRNYYELQLDDINHEIEALNRYIRYHRNEQKAVKYANRNDGYLKLINPIFEQRDSEELEWVTNYNKSTFLPENLIYKALDGNYYRSKSESIIATRLYARGISFRYECALELSSGKIVYPDFMIKHPVTGEIFIWEHLGMMNNQQYLDKNLRKLYDYSYSGFFPYKNLILTYEDENNFFDIEEIDKLIDYFFGH